MNAPESYFLKHIEAEARPSPVAAPLAAPLQDASYIGQAIPRPNIERLAQGRGQYVDDLELSHGACRVLALTRGALPHYWH